MYLVQDRYVEIINRSSYADVVRSVSFHEDEPILLSGSDDCTVKLWNWRAAGTVGYAKYAPYHRLITFFDF